MSADIIVVSSDGQFATIALNHPNKCNAITAEALQEIERVAIALRDKRGQSC
jgi:enoyl-CoA hydratase/carnithine racemase